MSGSFSGSTAHERPVAEHVLGKIVLRICGDSGV
jgi:hypothetical protein